MTRVAVNSTPKSFKGSKRNNLILDQSKVDLNLIDNNIIYEIEEENKNNVVVTNLRYYHYGLTVF